MNTEKILNEIANLPMLGGGTVPPDAPDHEESTVKLTVGDVRTIRRLRQLYQDTLPQDSANLPG